MSCLINSIINYDIVTPRLKEGGNYLHTKAVPAEIKLFFQNKYIFYYPAKCLRLAKTLNPMASVGVICFYAVFSVVWIWTHRERRGLHEETGKSNGRSWGGELPQGGETRHTQRVPRKTMQTAVVHVRLVWGEIPHNLLSNLQIRSIALKTFQNSQYFGELMAFIALYNFQNSQYFGELMAFIALYNYITNLDFSIFSS